MGQLPPKLQAEVDSLNVIIANQAELALKAEAMSQVSKIYQLFLPDTALSIANEIVEMGENAGDELVKGIGLLALGERNANGIGGSPQLAMERIGKALHIFQAKKDEKHLSTAMVLMGTMFGQFGQVDSAMHYCFGGLRAAKASGNARNEIVALKVSAITMMRIGRIEISDSLMVHMTALAKSEGLPEQLFQSYLIHGKVNVVQGDYLGAQQKFLACTELAEELENKKWAGEAYVALTEPYMLLREFENAKEYALKSVRNLEEVKATMNLQLAYMAAGASYLELEMADSAAYYLKKGLYSAPASLHPHPRTAMLLHLAEACYIRGEWDRALVYSDTAFQIASQLKIENLLGLCHLMKAKVYLENGSPSKAVQFGEKALGIMANRSSPRDVLNANYILYRAYKAQGNTSKALEIHETWADQKAELITDENLRGYSKLEERHLYTLQAAQDSVVSANEKRVLEAETLAAQAEMKQTNQRNLYLILILAFVAVLGLGILFLFLQTRRQKSKIETQKQDVDKAYHELSERDEEKQTLLREIHHRVKNNLQIVSSLLQLQAYELDHPDALAAVEDGQNRVKAMALIHEKLYQSENIAKIDFKEYTDQLVLQIGTIYSGKEQIESHVVTEVQSVDIDTAIPLGLILTELVSNAYKYAFDELIEGQIEIALKDLGKDRYQLEIKDNGPGLSEGFDINMSKSLGLRLVQNLARQLYGSVAYSFENGAVFSVEFANVKARKALE